MKSRHPADLAAVCGVNGAGLLLRSVVGPGSNLVLADDIAFPCEFTEDGNLRVNVFSSGPIYDLGVETLMGDARRHDTCGMTPSDAEKRPTSSSPLRPLLVGRFGKRAMR